MPTIASRCWDSTPINRPIYLNRQTSNGYGRRLPVDRQRARPLHVMVDGRQYELNEADPKRDHPHWPNPVGEVPTRSAFSLWSNSLRRGASHWEAA